MKWNHSRTKTSMMRLWFFCLQRGCFCFLTVLYVHNSLTYCLVYSVSGYTRSKSSGTWHQAGVGKRPGFSLNLRFSLFFLITRIRQNDKKNWNHGCGYSNIILLNLMSLKATPALRPDWVFRPNIFLIFFPLSYIFMFLFSVIRRELEHTWTEWRRFLTKRKPPVWIKELRRVFSGTPSMIRRRKSQKQDQHRRKVQTRCLRVHS